MFFPLQYYKNHAPPYFMTQPWTFIVSCLLVVFIFQTWHFNGATQKSTYRPDMSDQSDMFQVSSCFGSFFLFLFDLKFFLSCKVRHIQSGSRGTIPSSVMQIEQHCSGENGVAFARLWGRGSFVDFPQSKMLCLMTEPLTMMNIFAIRLWCSFSGSILMEELVYNESQNT